MEITFTFDLEDHRPQPNYSPRFPAITQRILAFLDEHKVKGTFFVLGEVAQKFPRLVHDIHHRGHEIGYHSYAHIPLTRENQARFKEQTQRSKSLIEDLIGESVVGFRAPCFSLTPATLWVLPILTELGFRYSSSVTPVWSPLYCFPGAPRQPFRWKDFLLEIPAPIAQIGPLSGPFLGGVYMRYLPKFILQFILNGQTNSRLWTYCHPYDFDPNEKFVVMRETSFIISLLLWFNRKKTFDKLSMILNHGVGLPFRENLNNGVYNSAPIFDPSSLCTRVL